MTTHTNLRSPDILVPDSTIAQPLASARINETSHTKARHHVPIPLRIVAWNADGLWQWDTDKRDRKAHVPRSLLQQYDVICLSEAHVNASGLELFRKWVGEFDPYAFVGVAHDSKEDYLLEATPCPPTTSIPSVGDLPKGAKRPRELPPGETEDEHQEEIKKHLVPPATSKCRLDRNPIGGHVPAKSGFLITRLETPELMTLPTMGTQKYYKGRCRLYRTI